MKPEPLLIPCTIAEKARDPIVKRLAGVDEPTMAVNVVKTIISWGGLKHTNTVMWLNIKL